jgi:hypothetical protein
MLKKIINQAAGRVAVKRPDSLLSRDLWANRLIGSVWQASCDITFAPVPYSAPAMGSLVSRHNH